MSRFSGKCDFCDEIEIHGLENILRSDIYLGHDGPKLELNCLADCVPYYQHIVSSAYWNNAEGRGVVHLTKRPWPEIEAERYGVMRMHSYYKEVFEKELELARNGHGIYERR